MRIISHLFLIISFLCCKMVLAGGPGDLSSLISSTTSPALSPAMSVLFLLFLIIGAGTVNKLQKGRHPAFALLTSKKILSNLFWWWPASASRHSVSTHKHKGFRRSKRGKESPSKSNLMSSCIDIDELLPRHLLLTAPNLGSNNKQGNQGGSDPHHFQHSSSSILQSKTHKNTPVNHASLLLHQKGSSSSFSALESTKQADHLLKAVSPQISALDCESLTEKTLLVEASITSSLVKKEEVTVAFSPVPLDADIEHHEVEVASPALLAPISTKAVKSVSQKEECTCTITIVKPKKEKVKAPISIKNEKKRSKAASTAVSLDLLPSFESVAISSSSSVAVAADSTFFVQPSPTLTFSFAEEKQQNLGFSLDFALQSVMAKINQARQEIFADSTKDSLSTNFVAPPPGFSAPLLGQLSAPPGLSPVPLFKRNAITASIAPAAYGARLSPGGKRPNSPGSHCSSSSHSPRGPSPVNNFDDFLNISKKNSLMMDARSTDPKALGGVDSISELRRTLKNLFD